MLIYWCQTHVARQIVQSLGSIPTVIILSQVIQAFISFYASGIHILNYDRKDSFYKFHSPEELELAHANMLDFDHPDAIDMPMFTRVSTIGD
jgi:uridine kinase